MGTKSRWRSVERGWLQPIYTQVKILLGSPSFVKMCPSGGMEDTLVLGTSAFGVGVQVPPGVPRFADVVELEDTNGSNPFANSVQVQVLSSAPSTEAWVNG